MKTHNYNIKIQERHVCAVGATLKCSTVKMPNLLFSLFNKPVKYKKMHVQQNENKTNMSTKNLQQNIKKDQKHRRNVFFLLTKTLFTSIHSHILVKHHLYIYTIHIACEQENSFKMVFCEFIICKILILFSR